MTGRTRRIRHLIAVLALAIATALVATGCYPHPRACGNHGGVRVYVKAIYYCNDGTTVGNGWLWLHHKQVAP